MSTESAIHESIERAAQTVGSVWPLHSFVTANPLAGFEDRPFHAAVDDAERLLGGDGYPDPALFRAALEADRIDTEILREELAAHGYESDPENSLERMADTTAADTAEAALETERVDAVVTKWLAAFLDQGQADWSMPDREAGFYQAFRSVAPHDSAIPDAAADLPDEPVEAIQDALAESPVGEWETVFRAQLAALPGWTGFIKQRVADDDAWQSAYPITLAGYLAVRLTLVDCFDAPVVPEAVSDDAEDERDVPRPECWLRAWERSYRDELVDPLTDASATLGDDTGTRPDAQLVFCIDTRSEILRRHIEAAGDYETHGYAGFFGVPMRYDGYGTDVTVDACPPILDAEHRIVDRPATTQETKGVYDRWQATLRTTKQAIKRLESNAATAFSFVESAGPGYGVALAARTLLPRRVYDLVSGADERVPDGHEFCEPTVDYDPDTDHALPAGLTHQQKVEYAATAFELMGWEEFARVVVFTGHASQTANNPFDSSLDCGACAGNPGGPNARVLAAICNDEAVQSTLRERGIEIPEDTVFVAGEHNTTTDEVELYADDVPASHEDAIEQLRTDLASARADAATERARDMGADGEAGIRETERRAADWAETRPEWGLAGNAGFVVGPRDLTDGIDLDGRSFLHSYDWSTDPDGNALEAIMAGPMVVTQWINTQYYFATVDNAAYGSGSKVTHNAVGNIGVYQGNGGDLMTGLPSQSLMSADDEPYHQPLRLSTVIHAPVERVTEILAANERLQSLLDNDWLSLTVVDPEQDHRAFEYTANLEWTPLSTEAKTPETAPTVTPDD
ncbi:hypothetical protein SAMN05216226_108184 [Halovenus aranensis]|uniref:Probable inorganic carbon transporter subunit DabA n=1 Tax=Halovenus aranensis TaxID=890420 RepID=A0A1G8WBI1_9EURY|nr:DUF2309 domain-containing protein [Halovenus aranensis]SDJ75608.1 hypothetical protein SAMN05216226_108184 [Halovenus aranensis]